MHLEYSYLVNVNLYITFYFTVFRYEESRL